MLEAQDLTILPSRKILVVDDAADIKRLVGRFFEAEGFEVVYASNGSEALSLLRNGESLPAFVLLDLMMPVMDGFEFIKQKLNDARLCNLPVVVMTADNSRDAMRMAQKVHGFLKKPFDISELLEAAHRYCQ